MREERLVWRDFGSSGHRKLTMQAILSDKIAKKSYSNLLAKGLKNTELLQELVGAIVAVGSEGNPAKWYSDLKMTPKTIAYFPTRLRGMADETEKLTAHPLYFIDDGFTELPTVLRNYADRVEERSRLLRQSRKGRPKELGQILDALRWLVRKDTGKERHADLGRLLTAAARSSPGSNPDFDFEAALKMRASRAPLK